MVMKKYTKVDVFALFLCLAALPSFAQGYNYWPFGYKSGLNFNFEPPRMEITHATGNDCAAICDSTGKLLFYTDAFANSFWGTPQNDSGIWNKNNVQMPNAWQMEQDLTESPFINNLGKTIFILPKSKNEYYLFYIFQDSGIASGGGDTMKNGLYYSIVNMALDGGMGDLETSPVRVPVDYHTFRSLAAVKNNDNDYWLVASDMVNFYSFRVRSGIISSPVLSPSHALHIYNGHGGASFVLKSSTSGAMLISLSWFFLPGSYRTPDTTYNNVCVYDFDKNTGIVSNHDFIINQTTTSPKGIDYNMYFDATFSPNDSLIYVSNLTLPYILQFQRYAPDVKNSKIKIPAPLGLGGIQLGPDGKIYTIIYNEADFSISVINYPDIIGTGCKLSLGAVRLDSNQIYYYGTLFPTIFVTVQQQI